MTTTKGIVAGCAAAIFLICAGPSPASAQVEGEAALATVMSKARPFQEAMIETQSIFLEALDHINAAFERGEEPLSKAEAEKWSAGWETRTRARLAAVKARVATAPRVTVEEAREVFGSSDTRGLDEVIAGAPKAVETALATAEKTVNLTATLAPLVAAGDEAAGDKLSRELFSASLYMVEMENQTLRSAIASLTPGHPQRSFAQSVLASNLASMEIQRVSLRAYNGEPLQAQAAADRIRTHLAEAETAARRMPSEAKAMLAQARRGAPPEAKAFLAKVETAFASFEESSKVELEAVRIMRAALPALAREDLEALGVEFEKAEALYDRRIALQSQRAAALAQ